ncbi:MAG: hypothetical protein JNL96_26725 [Planctomycetaceae bacterium]|nr:hypothetical protein [Planctomycetaceae bacterium]
MNSTGSNVTKGPLVLWLLIITVGVGWLLSARGIGAEINWIWTLGLGVVGILTFVISGGLDKWSIIVGPFFLASSVLSILRQTGKLPFDTEVPVLVIFVGVLLLIAQTSLIPPPQWFQPLDAKKPGDR